MTKVLNEEIIEIIDRAQKRGDDFLDVSFLLIVSSVILLNNNLDREYFHKILPQMIQDALRQVAINS